MKQWQAVSIGQLQHQLVTSSELFCNQSWVSHVGCLHEGTASASARRLSITATGAMARCAFDIVLVYYHQREKRTPPRDQQQDDNRGDGGGQVMQLSLHDMTGQSWVSHVGPSFSVFLFLKKKVFLMVDLLRLFLWSVAVVMTKRPLEKLVLPSKSSMTCETSVFRSAATSPLIFASVSHSTN